MGLVVLDFLVPLVDLSVVAAGLSMVGVGSSSLVAVVGSSSSLCEACRSSGLGGGVIGLVRVGAEMGGEGITSSP